VFSALALKMDALLDTQSRVLTRLRELDAHLRAAAPRLDFVAAVNTEVASELESFALHARAAVRRCLSSAASLLAQRVRALCSGGDARGWAPLTETAQQQLQALLDALPPADAVLATLPAPSSEARAAPEAQEGAKRRESKETTSEQASEQRSTRQASEGGGKPVGRGGTGEESSKYRVCRRGAGAAPSKRV
jgi:hypothetical protein